MYVIIVVNLLNVNTSNINQLIRMTAVNVNIVALFEL
jgi:hypothetical protein